MRIKFHQIQDYAYGLAFGFNQEDTSRDVWKCDFDINGIVYDDKSVRVGTWYLTTKAIKNIRPGRIEDIPGLVEFNRKLRFRVRRLTDRHIQIKQHILDLLDAERVLYASKGMAEPLDDDTFVEIKRHREDGYFLDYVSFKDLQHDSDLEKLANLGHYERVKRSVQDHGTVTNALMDTLANINKTRYRLATAERVLETAVRRVLRAHTEPVVKVCSGGATITMKIPSTYPDTSTYYEMTDIDYGDVPVVYV